MKPTAPAPAILAALLILAPALTLRASESYGTLNNFDTVNDTGEECHGFEIELEDMHSSDISHTYNYNHYGTSKISEDNSDPAHPLCIIRWESAKNPDGSWAAYTAIPDGPISPTNGHQFTNPNVNFGGEHFGVGYRKAPGAVRYHWLLDDGNGNLVAGPPVQVSTPTFVYSPGIGGAGGRVGAAIEAPEPPEFHPKEFGPAVWVKEIRTTSHNNNKVKLRDLVSDDPDDDEDINWRNGEPDEVEVEWQILQTEFGADDGGGNNELVAEPEDLDDGDEVVTRRYEFYQYTGPFDNESGEVATEKVGDDDIHGEGTKTVNGVEVDLSNVVVVGDYIGAQMAAFDAEGKLTLVEQLQDAELGEPYPPRLVVIPGQTAFTVTLSGHLPDGLELDPESGILSGTPSAEGEFTFTVRAEDAEPDRVIKTYTIVVAAAGQELPPHAVVDTGAMPVGRGTTSGDGSYGIGEVAMLVAVPEPGYEFAGWSERGKLLGDEETLALTVDINHSVIANFVLATHRVTTRAVADSAGTTAGGGEFADGAAVTVTAMPNAGYQFVNWTEAGSQVSAAAEFSFAADLDRDLDANFTTVGGQVRTLDIAAPAGAGGTVFGAGTYVDGATVTIVATPAPGYLFRRWLNGGFEFSTAATHTFTLDAALQLSAEFEIGYAITTVASPAEAGTTSGAGLYPDGQEVGVNAAANAGYQFINWTDGGAVVSRSSHYTFAANPVRDLVANFALEIPRASIKRGIGGEFILEWLTPLPGWVLEESPDLSEGSWFKSPAEIQADGEFHQASTPPSPSGRRFFRLKHP